MFTCLSHLVLSASLDHYLGALSFFLFYPVDPTLSMREQGLCLFAADLSASRSRMAMKPPGRSALKRSNADGST